MRHIKILVGTDLKPEKFKEMISELATEGLLGEDGMSIEYDETKAGIEEKIKSITEKHLL